MNPVIQTWNGNSLQSSDFKAICPKTVFSSLIASANYSDRAPGFPYLSNANWGRHIFPFRVYILNRAQLNVKRNVLRGYFGDLLPHTLVIYDSDDGNRSWYLSGIVITVNEEQAGWFTVNLALTDPILRVSSASTDSWAVTTGGAGNTKALTVLGNYPAKPIFTYTPTSARAGGYGYKKWVPVYNVLSASAFNTYQFDLCSAAFDTASLVNDTSVSNQINQGGGITAAATTIPIDTSVGGGLATSGGLCYCGTEQIYYTAIAGGNMTVYDDGAGTTGRGWGGTTAATHADNAVLARSKMQANGNDLRVFVDGNEVNRWLSGMNGANTKIWINIDLPVKQETTLKTAIAGSGAVSTVSIPDSPANQTLLNYLAKAKNKVLYIGTEAFTYTGVSTIGGNYGFTGCTRAMKGTSMGAHAVGDTIRWLPHDYWIVYGNWTVTAPSTDDTQKPITALTSTNTSWVYTQYRDTTSTRPGRFSPERQVSWGKQSTTYTADQGALANPATEMGMSILAYTSQNVWKAETATLDWVLYNPAGFTNVLYSGKVYTLSTSWPTVMGLQKSTDGTNWTTVKTESKPTANTWTAYGANNQALGATYQYIRFVASGSIAALANNQSSIQVDTVTLTIDSNYIPVTALGAEQAGYYINSKITNNTTGEYFTIACNTALNSAVTIDCNAKTVTAADGSNLIGSITFSTVRNDWLNLTGGATNTLQIDDTGIAGATIGISWTDCQL